MHQRMVKYILIDKSSAPISSVWESFASSVPVLSLCCLDHQDPRVSVGKSTVLPWRQARKPSGSCLGDKVRSHIQTHVSLDLRESFHPHVNCHSHVTDETFLTFRTSTGMSTSPWQMIPTLFETLSSPPSLVALKLFILIINTLTSSFLSSLYRVSV